MSGHPYVLHKAYLAREPNFTWARTLHVPQHFSNFNCHVIIHPSLQDPEAPTKDNHPLFSRSLFRCLLHGRKQSAIKHFLSVHHERNSFFTVVWEQPLFSNVAVLMSCLCPSVVTFHNEHRPYRHKLVYLREIAYENLSILEVSPRSFQNFENEALQIFELRKIAGSPTDSLIYLM
jgi:hypothetical protein